MDHIRWGQAAMIHNDVGIGHWLTDDSSASMVWLALLLPMQLPTVCASAML